MVFHRSLSDSKSPQISRTLLNILGVLNNAVVERDSTRPPTSKSPSPFSPLVTVPNTPITIGIIVTIVFSIHNQGLDTYPSFHIFQFYSVVSRDNKVDNFTSSIFFRLITLKSGFLADIRWSVCISKSHRSCVCHSPGLLLCNVYSICSYVQSKFPQVSRTLLSILAVLSNVVVWMVSTRPPTSESSSPFSNALVTVPNAPITIVIIVTCMFHSFFLHSLARLRHLSFFSHSFSFILWSAGTAKSTILQVLSCLLIIIMSGLLAEIR